MGCRTPIRIIAVNLRFQGAASDGKTTTEALSFTLSLNNVMGIWLHDDPMKGGTDMNNIFYIIGLVVVVLFVAGYFGLR